MRFKELELYSEIETISIKQAKDQLFRTAVREGALLALQVDCTVLVHPLNDDEPPIIVNKDIITRVAASILLDAANMEKSRVNS